MLAKLNAGANFAKLAAEESTDPGAQDKWRQADQLRRVLPQRHVA